MDLFLEGLKNGLAMGSIFALMALGYSMVYGIVKMINFAHSEFITIGGFVAYYFTEKALVNVLGDTIWSLLVALIIAVIVCVVIALVTERFAYRPLRKKGSTRITALITAIGVSYILNGILNAIEPEQLVFKQFANKNTSFYIAIITTTVLLVALTLFVKKTNGY